MQDKAEEFLLQRPLQDLTHLIVYPASKPLRRAIFSLVLHLQFFTYGPAHGASTDCLVTVEFLLSRKGSGSTTINIKINSFMPYLHFHHCLEMYEPNEKNTKCWHGSHFIIRMQIHTATSETSLPPLEHVISSISDTAISRNLKKLMKILANFHEVGQQLKSIP